MDNKLPIPIPLNEYTGLFAKIIETNENKPLEKDTIIELAIYVLGLVQKKKIKESDKQVRTQKRHKLVLYILEQYILFKHDQDINKDEEQTSLLIMAMRVLVPPVLDTFDRESCSTCSACFAS